MDKTTFRERIRSGEALVSTMLSMIRNPGWQRILADLPFDFISIDVEHSPYSDSDVADLLAVLSAGSMPTVVRIPRPQWHFVTKVFDAGASGVLAPYCETVEEVQEVVRAARWRPMKGALADRAVTTGDFPSDATKAHLEDFNRGHTVIIGIESVPAVENLDAILDIEGIDVVFIGPADLSTSMGIPRDYHHPEFDRVVRHIIEKCRARGVQVAANFADLEQSVKWASEGINLIIHSMDYRVFHEGYRTALAAIGEAAGKELDVAKSTAGCG